MLDPKTKYGHRRAGRRLKVRKTWIYEKSGRGARTPPLPENGRVYQLAGARLRNGLATTQR